MGLVYRARHPEGVDVAVKVLRPDVFTPPTGDPEEARPRRDHTLLEAFRAEVRSVASLDHPHVVRVLDSGVVPEATAAASGGTIPRGSPWLAMELADNGTLGDHVTLPNFETLAHVVGQLLEGLGYAHARGLVHRDLKPRNVLLLSTPGRSRAALTDFGIAHLEGRADPNAAQAGTPGYMAPEQIRGERRLLGPWTDLYALGCVVYRMGAGRPPFQGPTKYHVLKAHLTADPPRWRGAFPVPDGFEDWWRRLMAREPFERFRSAADAAAALRTFAAASGPGEGWRPRHTETAERPRGTGLGLFLLRPWPLVGREREQEALWDHLLRVRARITAGRPVAAPRVWLRAARGLGRTRLATWFGQRAEETGLAESWTFPADVAVRRRLRTLLRLDGASATETRVTLERWHTQRGSPSPAADAQRLADALADGPAPFAALDVFRRAAHDRPLIVVFDDVHEARDDVRRLFLDLADPDRGPVLVVATTPDDEVPQELAGTLAGGIELPLGPLEPPDRERLVRFPGLTARLQQAVVARTGGNPWFVVRLVTDWARSGGLVPTSHGYDLRPGFEPALPEELVGHGLERLTRARGALRDAVFALELLALLGATQVREDEWRAACERTGAPWHPARLVATGAVQVARAGRTVRYSLADPLSAEALLHALSRSGRKPALHLAVAEALLGIPRAGAQERATHHLAAAGQIDRALGGLRAAVDEAFHHERLDRAQGFLAQERALLAAQPLPEDDPRRLIHELDGLRVALGTGRAVAPGTLLARASRSASPLVRARAAAVELELVGAPASDARWETCSQALQAVGDGRTWRRLLGWRARWRSSHGEVEGALADVEAARSEADQAQDPLHVDRFEGLQVAILVTHRHPRALEALTTARRRAQQQGRGELAARWLAWTSAVRRARGAVADATRYADAARDELSALGLPTGVAAVQCGLCALHRKAPGEAGGWFGRVLAEGAAAPEDVVQLARAGLLVATADADQFDLWDQAFAELVAALPEGDDPGAFPTLDPDVPACLDLAAITALQRGEVARARQALTVALRHHAARRDAAAAERTRERLAAIS